MECKIIYSNRDGIGLTVYYEPHEIARRDYDDHTLLVDHQIIRQSCGDWELPDRNRYYVTYYPNPNMWNELLTYFNMEDQSILPDGSTICRVTDKIKESCDKSRVASLTQGSLVDVRDILKKSVIEIGECLEFLKRMSNYKWKGE